MDKTCQINRQPIVAYKVSFIKYLLKQIPPLTNLCSSTKEKSLTRAKSGVGSVADIFLSHKTAVDITIQISDYVKRVIWAVNGNMLDFR